MLYQLYTNYKLFDNAKKGGDIKTISNHLGHIYSHTGQLSPHIQLLRLVRHKTFHPTTLKSSQSIFQA